MIVRGEAPPAPLVFPFVKIVLRVAPIAELGIRGKFLYAWRDKGFGTNGVRRDVIRAVPADKADPRQQQIERQQKKIAELERLTGQQAAELDFFASALRAVEEPRPKTDASSGGGSQLSGYKLNRFNWLPESPLRSWESIG